MELTGSPGVSGYLIPPLASAAILVLETRAPRRVYWPIIVLGVIALVTTGYRHAGVAPEMAAALPPLATAINVRSTERYLDREHGRAVVMTMRWLVAIFCYAIVALAIREVLAVTQG
jgi:hypothetical protein